MILIFLSLLILFGWQLVNLLSRRLTIHEHLGLSFMLGVGIHSIIYFVLVIWKRILPIESSVLLLLLEILLATIISIKFKLTSTHTKEKKQRLKITEILLISISIIAIGYTAIQNLYWPPYTPDALHLYDFRARRLFDNDIDGFFHGTKYIHSKNYPPFTSLLHFFIYDVGGSNPKSAYTILFISFYLTLYGYTKRVTGNRMKGLLVSTLTILTPSIWWNSFLAMTNIPLTEYFSLSILYLTEIKLNRINYSKWPLSGLLLGLSTWIRLEAIWIPAVLLAIIYAVKANYIKQIILYLLIFGSIAWIWPTAVNVNNPFHRLGVETDSLIQTITTSYSQPRTGIDHILRASNFVLNYSKKSWGQIPIFLLILIVIQFLKKIAITYTQKTTLLLGIGIIVGFIGFTWRYPDWEILGDAIYRMTIFLIPLYWVSIIESPSLWSMNRKIGNEK